MTSPDIVIVEGLNVLQVPPSRAGVEERFVSDFFDFSIYVDADEDDIRRWYIERFLALRETAFVDEQSFFHHFAEARRVREAPRGSRTTRCGAEINARSTCARTSHADASRAADLGRSRKAPTTRAAESAGEQTTSTARGGSRSR